MFMSNLSGIKVVISIVLSAISCEIFAVESVLKVDNVPQKNIKGNSVRGELLYQKMCTGCHSVKTNSVGPKHQNTYGQPVASVDNFRYSKALRSSELIWTEETLDQWLSDPEELIPGQVMYYSVVDGTNRRDVIAYLRKVSEHNHQAKLGHSKE